MVALIAAGGLAYASWESSRDWKQTAERYQGEADQQSGIVAGNAMRFQRLNEISANAHRYDVRIDAATEGKQVIYREKIRLQECAAVLIPNDVATGLLHDAHALRSRSMSGTTADPIRETAFPAPPESLTYGQALEWLAPILGYVDKLYARLDAIQEADRTRSLN